MRIRIQLFSSMRIRILLLIKGCQYATAGLQTLHLRVHGTPRLHCEPRKLLSFDFTADLDPAFHSNTNPDPASKHKPDPKPLFFLYSQVSMYLTCGSPLIKYLIFSLSCKTGTLFFTFESYQAPGLTVKVGQVKRYH